MNAAALQRAEAMGRRAGEFLMEFGVPSRSPFDPLTQRELHKAYGRGYVAALRTPAKGRR